MAKVKPEILIQEKVVFEFTYEHNAKNVALALSLAGYYVKIGEHNGHYFVGIYTDRCLPKKSISKGKKK